MNTNPLSEALAWAKANLAALPRCRVREDALKVLKYMYTWSPKDRSFAFPRSIAGQERFVRWTGITCESRVRSCVNALKAIGALDQQNDDTHCRYLGRGTFKDTPNQYLFGAAFTAFFLPAAQTPAMKDSTFQNRAPVIVVARPGKPRSQTIWERRLKAACPHCAQKAQGALPVGAKSRSLNPEVQRRRAEQAAFREAYRTSCIAHGIDFDAIPDAPSGAVQRSSLGHGVRGLCQPNGSRLPSAGTIGSSPCSVL